MNYNHFVIARLRGLELDENHLKQLEEKIAKGEDSEDIEMLKRSAHDFQVAKEMEISLFEYLYREFNNVVQDEDLPF
ncbi:hypothetical protein B4088_2495 [Bacillus cereus]|uniref:Uncharacterized protein n=1 Tax=Bacillus cereus TaxID=1396 RepID=A0A164P822_BACCE|nr:hypothetical protein B4088_2495 [Bacillus cereus]